VLLDVVATLLIGSVACPKPKKGETKKAIKQTSLDSFFKNFVDDTNVLRVDNNELLILCFL
jgi:hypothetical protein